VVRVQVKHVWEVPITTLAAVPTGEIDDAATLNPLTQGYAVTGDQNIAHVDMVARYRVREPAKWAFYGPAAEDILRVEVTAAMVRSLGEMSVDRVLSDGRKDLIAQTARRAQAGLDGASSGLELSSLELTALTPPLVLAEEFNAVQTAFISAETKRKDAQAYAASAIPEAQSRSEAALQSARGFAASDLARARGEADAFRVLAREYRVNPMVVRERLYRDAVESAISGAGNVRWVPPPPAGGRYQGFRITIPSGASSRTPAAEPGDD